MATRQNNISPSVVRFVIETLKPRRLQPLPAPDFIENLGSWESACQFAAQVEAALPFLAALQNVSWKDELSEAVALRLEERLYRERMMLAIFDQELDSSMFLLINAGIPFVLLGGMDIGRRYYPNRISRSVQENNFLILDKDFQRALEVLQQGEYQSIHHTESANSPGALFTKRPSGPCVRIQTRINIGDSSTATASILARADRHPIPGLPTHAKGLAPEDLFIQTLIATVRRSPSFYPMMLNDLHHLLEHREFHEQVDWEHLTWSLAQHGASSGAWFVLNFMTSNWKTEVPEEGLRELDTRISPWKKNLLLDLSEKWSLHVSCSHPKPSLKSRLLLQDRPLNIIKEAVRHAMGLSKI